MLSIVKKVKRKTVPENEWIPLTWRNDVVIVEHDPEGEEIVHTLISKQLSRNPCRVGQLYHPQRLDVANPDEQNTRENPAPNRGHDRRSLDCKLRTPGHMRRQGDYQVVSTSHLAHFQLPTSHCD